MRAFGLARATNLWRRSKVYSFIILQGPKELFSDHHLEHLELNKELTISITFASCPTPAFTVDNFLQLQRVPRLQFAFNFALTRDRLDHRGDKKKFKCATKHLSIFHVTKIRTHILN